MPLVFYYDLMSQPCRAVYIFLKASGIPFESKEIGLRKLEQTTEGFARINPFKKVPVIDDDGFILTERFDWRKNNTVQIYFHFVILVWLFSRICAINIKNTIGIRSIYKNALELMNMPIGNI